MDRLPENLNNDRRIEFEGSIQARGITHKINGRKGGTDVDRPQTVEGQLLLGLRAPTVDRCLEVPWACSGSSMLPPWPRPAHFLFPFLPYPPLPSSLLDLPCRPCPGHIRPCPSLSFPCQVQLPPSLYSSPCCRPSLGSCLRQNPGLQRCQIG